MGRYRVIAAAGIIKQHTIEADGVQIAVEPLKLAALACVTVTPPAL